MRFSVVGVAAAAWLFLPRSVAAREALTFSPEMSEARKSADAAGLQLKASRLKNLEALKTTAPGLYETERRKFEAEESISLILARFHGGKLSKEAASRQLRPLLREQLKPEIDSLPERIAAAEKHLALLKKEKQEPGLLIERRLDDLLEGPRENGAMRAPPPALPPLMPDRPIRPG